MQGRASVPADSGRPGAAGTPVPPLDPGLVQRFGLIFSRCPYGFDQPAVYHQAGFMHLNSQTMGALLENGYRRNGNHMYTMHCPGCRGCVSIRLDPAQFRPNRNQKRVWRRNQDIVVQPGPLLMSREHLSLLDKFLRIRFHNQDSQAESYYSQFFLTTISPCFELRYWAGGVLVGVAIVDATPEWLNAVYFYFDPDQGWRSPGTFNILNLVRFCRQHGIPKLYLGYCIEGLLAMAYKKAFRPHELLLQGQWRRIA